MERAIWEPDGWGWRARIGVLTPHADIGPESEFRAMSPNGVSIHAARVPLASYSAGGMEKTLSFAPIRAFSAPPLVDDAAELLAAAPLHAIAFAFTSSSYVHGPREDALLKARLETRTHGIPVVIPCASAVVALRTLAVRRVALISPPWFSVEMDKLGAAYFEAEGFEIVHTGPAGLPSDQRAIHPGQLFEWVRDHTPASAEAVFIGGNGCRAVGVIRALEEDLGRPVLTANQVAFWHALRLSGTRAPIDRYGELFTRSPA